MQNIKEFSNKLFNKNFRLVFLFIFLVELISLSGYLIPQLNTLGFFVICLLVLVGSFKNLKYGLYLAMIELFIGSKGYLFYFENGGVSVSIRIAVWLIVLSVFFSKFILEFFKKKRLLIPWVGLKGLYLFLILFSFIGWGIVNGVLNNNGFNNIFLDFNGYLFFAYIFPFVYIAKKEENFIKEFLQIFFASIIWLSLKTLVLLFIFSHNLSGATTEVYRWVRVSGVGEITNIKSGFIRIFFQSHFFVLIGLFFTLFIFNQKKPRGKFFGLYISILTLFSSIAVISFSRSFWVGMVIAFFFYFILIFFKYGIKQILKTILILIISLLLSVGLIGAIIKFPYPPAKANFNLSQLTDRVKTDKNEAALSSRYALLPPLITEIKRSPIVGRGFGRVITYKSSDPRILSQTADGLYTTYAFEWGWLDIWLKLGIIGVGFYLFLIGKTIKDGIISNNYLSLALSVGMVFLVATSLFSPYTNHPIGIGYLILCYALLLNMGK